MSRFCRIKVNLEELAKECGVVVTEHLEASWSYEYRDDEGLLRVGRRYKGRQEVLLGWYHEVWAREIGRVILMACVELV